MFYALVCATLCPFWFCNHLDGEEKAGGFAMFVFLLSRECCGAMDLSVVYECDIS